MSRIDREPKVTKLNTTTAERKDAQDQIKGNVARTRKYGHAPVALTIGGGLLAAGIWLGIDALTGDDGDAKSPASSSDKTTSKTIDKDVLVPGGAGDKIDPNAKLEPLSEKISSNLMPQILTGSFIDLPQPGTPEQEAQDYCNVIAGAISSDKPELLRQLYGNTPGDALDNDEMLYKEYKEYVADVQTNYPATQPLLSLECSDVQLVPEEYANGSHRMSFSVTGSLVSDDGRVFSKGFWDKSNIAKDRTLTLNRDGYLIDDEGKEIAGLQAEFSELSDQ